MILQSIAFHQLIKSPDVLVQARQTIDAIVDSAPSLLPHKSIRMSIKSFWTCKWILYREYFLHFLHSSLTYRASTTVFYDPTG